MLDYREQRSYPRMPMDCPASFSVDGEGRLHDAVVKNLSGGGVLMWLDGQMAPGTSLDIEVAPPTRITPPMHARMRVLRCTPVQGIEGKFAVACMMEKLLD